MTCRSGRTGRCLLRAYVGHHAFIKSSVLHRLRTLTEAAVQGSTNSDQSPRTRQSHRVSLRSGRRIGHASTTGAPRLHGKVVVGTPRDHLPFPLVYARLRRLERRCNDDRIIVTGGILELGNHYCLTRRVPSDMGCAHVRARQREKKAAHCSWLPWQSWANQACGYPKQIELESNSTSSVPNRQTGKAPTTTS